MFLDLAKVFRRSWRPGLLVAGSLFLVACEGGEVPPLPKVGDPERGRELLEQVGCGSCHRVPGVPSANGEVGPPLEKIAKRAYLAGVLPNDFDNMVFWIAEPQSVAPGSAMPDLGLSEDQAKDIAAYLYTLR